MKEMTKKVDEKLTAQWKLEQNEKEVARVRGIKQLPEGAYLWFTGNWSKLIGKRGEKVKDGRTRVVIDFGELGRFNCLYTQITSDEPNASDIAVKKTIINYFNE